MTERTVNIIAQGSIPEFEHDGDDLDRYYLPVRGLQVALGQENSLVVLPDSGMVREFMSQSVRILEDINIQSPEPLFVPDNNYFLDRALEGNVELLQERVRRDDRHVLWPYSNTEVSDGWVRKFRKAGFGIENALPRKEYKEHQTREAWGRKILTPNTPSFPERFGIPYPLSYVASRRDELHEAYETVTGLSGKESVYLKLSASAGGFGVARVQNISEVDRFYEAVRNDGSLFLMDGVEQSIEVQEEIENIVGFGSIQYLGNNLQTPGGVSVQLLKGDNWVGNKFNVLNGYLNLRGREIFERFMMGMQTEHPEDVKGWGGVDMAIIQNETSLDLVVVENNWGRITGAHPGIYFANALGVSERPFMVRKLAPPKVDAAECWNMLTSEGISFDPVLKRGAIPFPWVRGVDAFIFVAGESDKEIMMMADEVSNLTARNGYH